MSLFQTIHMSPKGGRGNATIQKEVKLAMAIVRWEPFRDLLAMQDRMSRLFNETFGRDVPLFREEAASLSRWAPAVDVYETGDNIVVKVELPGVDPKDLDVRIEDNTLFLKGERKLEKEVKEENYHRIERSYGSFTQASRCPARWMLTRLQQSTRMVCSL